MEIVPFFGYKPYTFAGFVEVTSTNLLIEIFLPKTPLENNKANLVSIPGD